MAGKILTTDRHGRTRSRSASGLDGGRYLDEERHGALAAHPALFDDFEEIGQPEPDLTTLPSRMPDLERAEADRARERKRAEVGSGKRKAYLAAPKESLKGRGVTAEVLSMRRAPNGSYGGRTVPDSFHVTMLDPDGHVVYWRATEGALPEGLKPGAKVAIDSGTVKANRQSDFNGDYETVITRAKMRILGDDE